LDVKAIHDRLLKEHDGWKIPERRLHKFVKRHRGGGNDASEAVKGKTPGPTALFKRLFHPGKNASPEPNAPSASGNDGTNRAVAGSPSRSTAASSVDCGGTVSSEGIPSVVTTTTAPPTPLTGIETEADDAEMAAEAAASVPVVQRKIAEGDDVVAAKGADDDSVNAKPCFFCEGMSSGGCNIL
jgi:hypothetical protein